MAQGIVYRHAVEALINRIALGHQLFTMKELRERKLDTPRDMQMDEYVSFLREVARRLSPNATEDEALTRTGREMLSAYAQTFVGRTAFMVLRIGGVKKGVMRAADSMSTADDTTKLTAESLGERHVRIHANKSYGVSAFQVGLMLQLLETLGVKSGGKVTVTPGAGDEASYDVTW